MVCTRAVDWECEVSVHTQYNLIMNSFMAICIIVHVDNLSLYIYIDIHLQKLCVSFAETIVTIYTNILGKCRLLPYMYIQ